MFSILPVCPYCHLPRQGQGGWLPDILRSSHFQTFRESLGFWFLGSVSARASGLSALSLPLALSPQLAECLSAGSRIHTYSMGLPLRHPETGDCHVVCLGAFRVLYIL